MTPEEKIALDQHVQAIAKILNQVHVENCNFSPHPQPLSQRARGAGKAFKVPLPRELPCTHKSSDLASTGFDPPQPPLKKGGAGFKVPLFKGDLGGSRSTLIPCPRCVYTVAPGRGI